jgi:hypothetical protein
VPFSGDRAYIAFVNHGGGQRKFTRQGSAQLKRLDPDKEIKANPKAFLCRGATNWVRDEPIWRRNRQSFDPSAEERRRGTGRISALVRVLRWSSVAKSRLRPASLSGGRAPVRPRGPSARRLARQGRLELLRVAENVAQSLRSKSRIAADAPSIVSATEAPPPRIRSPSALYASGLSEECGDARGGAIRQVAAERRR